MSIGSQSVPMSVNAGSRSRSGAMFFPLLILAAFLGLLYALLQLPMSLPIGPMYWDLSVYHDGAQRIYNGQVPSVDFATPVGPLGYYLFAYGMQFFPNAHPLLLVQWSLLVITAPLMALIVAETAPRSRATAWALLLPFMLFSALPFNLVEYFPYPGVDGFGIYNRHTCHLLYLLAATVLFVRNRPVMVFVTAILAMALFFLKITGFIAGGLIFVYAVLAGRVGWLSMLVVLGAFVAALGALEQQTGLPASYIRDIAGLVESNSDSILRRFLTVASVKFEVVGPAAILILTMFWFGSRDIGAAYEENKAYFGRKRAFGAFFDTPLFWVAVILFASMVFETQNTGSHGFIALWPAIWLVLQRLDDFEGGRRTAIAVLCAAVALPSAVEITQRAARATFSQPMYISLHHENLKGLGMVSTKREILEHVDAIQEHYIRFKFAYAELAKSAALPGFILYSEPNFQIGWLRELDKLVAAIKEWERNNGKTLETIYSADFANPLAWLLDRQSTPYMQIGADVERTFQNPSPPMLAALKEADAIFLPRCPDTNARKKFRDMLAAALEGRRAVEITPCYTMMLRQ